jgi:SAM-dependent methyltransferase
MLRYHVYQDLGDLHNVSPLIHPEDHIFTFLQNYPPTKDLPAQYYFNDGANSATKLRDLLKSICGLGDRPFTLFEFASGYGCVTRHFKNALPNCAVTACDIHPLAMEFIEKELHVQTFLSCTEPEGLNPGRQYDVVFALSFFTHMPRDTWGRWLKKLGRLVNPGGSLIFTTHGIITKTKLKDDFEFEPDGFSFRPGSEQLDLNAKEYGMTYTHPLFVANQLIGLSLIPQFYQEGFWWTHQDVFVVKNGPGIVRQTLQEELDAIHRSNAWKTLLKYYNVRDKVLSVVRKY